MTYASSCTVWVVGVSSQSTTPSTLQLCTGTSRHTFSVRGSHSVLRLLWHSSTVCSWYCTCAVISDHPVPWLLITLHPTSSQYEMSTQLP